MKSDKFEDVYSLTPMQRGMLFHTLYAPNSGVYVLQFGCTVSGRLDGKAFRRAWQRVVDATPVLRTAIVWRRAEEPKQVVVREARVDVEEHDWSACSAEEQETRFKRLVAEDRRHGFRLTKPPLMRLRLARLGPDRHRFVWSKHHLLLDGWSHQLLMLRALRAYLEEVTGVSAPVERSLPFGDYVRWIERQDRAAAERAWRDVLRGFERPNRVEIARAAPVARGPRGDFTQLATRVPEENAVALRRFARERGITENTVFQGAWALVLGAYSGDEDVVFGATVSGRAVALPGIETAVGMFINTLPVRVRIDPAQEVAGWLESIQLQQAAMRDFEYAPLPDIRRWSDVPPGEPLFESIVVYENYPVADDFVRPEGAGAEVGLAITDVWSDERINYPLTLVVNPRTMDLVLAYDRRRFEPEAIARLAAHLIATIEAMTHPGARLRDGLRLPPAQRELEIRTFNATARTVPDDLCAHQLIERWSAQSPDAVAVSDRGRPLSYAELDRHANQLAHHLISMGVRRGARVGVLLQRSHELVTSFLAVLKSGAAFVPIDPGYPPDRLLFVMDDAQLAALVTRADTSASTIPKSLPVVDLASAARAIGQRPDADPRCDVVAGDPAYAIYTSGSTGRPKAVVLTHCGLVNTSLALAEAFELGPASRVLQFASVGFDGCVGDVFSTLSSGGTLCLTTREASVSAAAFADLIRRERITNVTAPPSFLRLVPAHDLPTLRVVACVGESCPAELVARWRPGRRLINGYGPSEIAIAATLHDCEIGGGPPPIGVPLANVRTYVLRGELEPVPAGVSGELYIAGRGIAIGYHGRPDLTAERFVPDALSGGIGERMYATGDVVRRRADGTLEFVGRRDEQVKIRGYRVELREIEAVLAAHELVKEAAVVVRDDEADKRLVACLVPNAGAASVADALRTRLASVLPDYMVPSVIIELTELPRNASGKIDRRRLREMSETLSTAAPAGPEVALTQTEQTLLGIWRRVLRRDDVAVDDDFFEVAGGDSLLAVRMVAEVERQLGRELPVNAVFDHPTIAGLAAVLDGKDEPPGAPDVSAARVELDPVIAPAADLERATGAGGPAFLTGATGFLGAHLLRELLDRTAGPIHCLVRAADADEARRRVRDNLELYGLWSAEHCERFVPVLGDLGVPRFGLSQEAFASLAGEVEAVYHCGACVNYLFPDARLHAPNVAGTEEVLRLATTARLKVVHHVSTLGVFSPVHLGRLILESDVPADAPEALAYARSKWAAEKLLAEARRRGIPVVVYRPGDVGGHSRTGACNSADVLCLTLEACIRIGAVPDFDVEFNVAPVDFVARGLLELSLRPESVGRTFHLCNPVDLPLAVVIDEVLAMGFPLRRRSFTEWRAELRRLAENDPGLARVAALWPDAPGAAAAVERGALPGWSYDCTEAQSMLGAFDVRCPVVDGPMLRRYITHMITRGFVPSPDGTAARELPNE